MNDSNKPFIEESSVREQDEKQKKQKKEKTVDTFRRYCARIFTHNDLGLFSITIGLIVPMIIKVAQLQSFTNKLCTNHWKYINGLSNNY